MLIRPSGMMPLIFRLQCSGLRFHVVLKGVANVLEEPTASIFSVHVKIAY
jgi:hypothetical protein